MNRSTVLGCEIDRLTMDATLDRCEEIISRGMPEQHVVVNAAKLTMMRKDPKLRAIVRNCALVNADGQAVVWASRLLGDPLPERVAGIDLMLRLLERAEAHGYRIFVLGAREHVLRRAVAQLRDCYPRLVIAGARNGYFDESESAEICDQIRSSRADILFVAMSSPKKEYWIAENRALLGTPFSMGVGGAIDVIAGVTARAPLWVQKVGLEWLFRLLQEPPRLARRYVVTNAQFVWLLAAEVMRRRVFGRPATC